MDLYGTEDQRMVKLAQLCQLTAQAKGIDIHSKKNKFL